MCFYNWNKTESSTPEKVFKPKTEGEFASIFQLAHKNNKQVRVVGAARHTWGGISMSDGYVIDMRYFNKVLSVDSKNKTATAQAGIVIHTLFRKLAKHDLSVNNMGGIDAQSLAGVISTGTHGSSLYHGTFSDDVLSMRVMLYNGKIITVNKDDSDFSAFIVSLGSLGAVLDVTLQCADLFYVHSETEEVQTKISNITKEYITPFLKKHHFFQVAIDPYSRKIVFYKRDKVEARDIPILQRKLTLPVKSFLQNIRELIGIYIVEFIVLKIITMFPGTTEKTLALSSKFAKEKFTDISYKALTIGGNDIHGFYINKTFHDEEYAVGLDDVSNALNKILEIFKEFPDIPLLLALRFVKASNAWLSPSFERDTCYIDVLIFAKNFAKWSLFVERVEKSLYQTGARPHWGKHNFLNYKVITENNLYPKLEEFRKAKQKYDPHNVFGNTYINERLSPAQSP